jgi:hypothetical protein
MNVDDGGGGDEVAGRTRGGRQSATSFNDQIGTAIKERILSEDPHNSNYEASQKNLV